MKSEQREEIIDSLLSDFSNDLIDNDDIVVDLVTRSNCYSWGLDDYQNLKTWQEDTRRIGFSVELHLSGERDEDAPSPLTAILVEVEGEAIGENNDWEISDYQVFEADYDLDFAEDRDYIDAVASNVNFFQTFSDEITSLKLLNTIRITNTKALSTLQRQIYIGTITCLETFLSDALINIVLSNEEFLKSFFSSYDFKEKKLEMKGLYVYAQKVEEIAKNELLEVRYHNLSKVSAIYKAVLKIDFPQFHKVAKAISTRHDLVHRNGKTKDGDDVYIDRDVVDAVIIEVEDFISEINQELEKIIFPEAPLEIEDEDIPF
jgi:hypothetical protein